MRILILPAVNYFVGAKLCPSATPRETDVGDLPSEALAFERDLDPMEILPHGGLGEAERRHSVHGEPFPGGKCSAPASASAHGGLRAKSPMTDGKVELPRFRGHLDLSL